MNTAKLAYAAACVIVPVLWGALVVWVSNRIENAVKLRGISRGQSSEQAAMPPLDYHI